MNGDVEAQRLERRLGVLELELEQYRALAAAATALLSVDERRRNMLFMGCGFVLTLSLWVVVARVV